MRFNQGDAFFADKGVEPLSVTKPGEAEEPVFNKVLDRVFPKAD